LFELSLVDEPANILSKIVICKRKDANAMNASEHIAELEGQCADLDSRLDLLAKKLDAVSVAKREPPPARPSTLADDIAKAKSTEELRAARRRASPEAFDAYRGAEAPRSPIVKQAVTDFDDIVEKIADGEKLSRTEALREARRRHPREFAAYVEG
jgi:hypothetical protein